MRESKGLATAINLIEYRKWKERQKKYGPPAAFHISEEDFREITEKDEEGNDRS